MAEIWGASAWAIALRFGGSLPAFGRLRSRVEVIASAGTRRWRLVAQQVLFVNS